MTTPNQSLNFNHTNKARGNGSSLSLNGNSGVAEFLDPIPAGGAWLTINNPDIDAKTKVDLNIVYPANGMGQLYMGAQEKGEGFVTFFVGNHSGEDTDNPVKIDMKLW